MPMFRRLLAASLLAWLVGCSDSVPTSPASPSLPAPLSYMVSGILSETVDGVSRPLAGRRVNLYVTGTCGQPIPGDCRPEKEEAVDTDQNGRYTAQVPDSWPLSPKTRVFVFNNGPEQQPCLASALVDKDTTIDVQVVPVGSSSTPPSAASPMITGFVYETTPQGRNPLRGVWAWLEVGYADSWAVAGTQTDNAGLFFFCRVNAPGGHPPLRMVVSGYQDWLEFIPGTGDMFFEIELRR